MTTVSVYNIHSWLGDNRGEKLSPDLCSLNTTLTLAESEESKRHRTRQVETAFTHFDGYSTTQNTSSLQGAYKEAVALHESQLLPNRPFHQMIKGASFIATNCLPKLRNHLVISLRNHGIRVDGLSTCFKTHDVPEGVSLAVTEAADQGPGHGLQYEKECPLEVSISPRV